MRSRALLLIGWLLALPGLALGMGLAAHLSGIAEAIGCRPERFLAVRCPDGVARALATDMHDVGTIVLLVPHVALPLILYSVVFMLVRLGAALLRMPEAAPGAR